MMRRINIGTGKETLVDSTFCPRTTNTLNSYLDEVSGSERSCPEENRRHRENREAHRIEQERELPCERVARQTEECPFGVKREVGCEQGAPCDEQASSSVADSGGDDETDRGRVHRKEDNAAVNSEEAECVREKGSDEDDGGGEQIEIAFEALTEEQATEGWDHIFFRERIDTDVSLSNQRTDLSVQWAKVTGQSDSDVSRPRTV